MLVTKMTKSEDMFKCAKLDTIPKIKDRKHLKNIYYKIEEGKVCLGDLTWNVSCDFNLITTILNQLNMSGFDCTLPLYL